jgi:taurine--2-oxoglutarate transaminase
MASPSTSSAAHDIALKHRRFVLTPWVAQGGLDAPTIVRGEGVYLYDADGLRYLDLTSGLIAANLGHGHPTVRAAMHAQIDRLCFGPPNWFNDTRAELAEALIELAPWAGEGGRAYFTTGGAQANEDAVKFARVLTGRPKVLSAYRSFHGSSPGAAALTGENRRWSSEPGVMPGVVRFWAPFPYRSPFDTTDPAEETARALAHLRRTVAAEDPARIAAILIEPVVGSNGVIVYPPGYLAGVRALCDETGIWLICDEVMTGFGRLGAAFGSTRLGVVPDAIAFAKGVTSAYAPLGGVLLRERYAAAFDATPLPGGHTYSGHPVAMSAGLGALQAYREEGVFERGAALEPLLRAKLEGIAARHEVVGEVRGLGAFFALEFVSDRAARTPLVAWQGAGLGVMAGLYAGLRRRGVYAFGRYNVLCVAPPLITSEPELDEAFAALDDAISELETRPSTGSG